MKNPKTMTVGELKAILNEYPNDLPVMMEYPSGDYWKTQIAKELNDAEELEVEYSEYHQKFKLGNQEEEDQDQDEPLYRALILS